MTSLEDLKSASNNDNNAAKATALDHLGLIAGRLRANNLKWNRHVGHVDMVAESSLQSVEEVGINSVFTMTHKDLLPRVVGFHR